MCKLVISVIVVFCTFATYANVDFKFDSRVEIDQAVKAKMERNISILLTEINLADSIKSKIDLSHLQDSVIEVGACVRLQKLWAEGLRFSCDKSLNIQKCLKDYQGYQVRNIPVTLSSNSRQKEMSSNKILVISCNDTGVITGFRFGLESQEDIENIMSNTLVGSIKDTPQRREILKWIEDYLSFYLEKNMDALKIIYDNYPIILKGSEIVQLREELCPDFETLCHGLNIKDIAIRKINQIFNGREIRIKLDNISVIPHGAKRNIYAVTFHEKLIARTYIEEGWLFVVWDFNNTEDPMILIRTWQPDQVVARDGVFTLDDFFIP